MDDLTIKKRSLARIHEYVSSAQFSVDAKTENAPLSIFCPLAGDDPFVQTAWLDGHHVTSIDLVPAAVEAMRRQFGGSEQDWTRRESSSGDDENSKTIVWKHKSGRVTLYEGDMMQKRPEWNGMFDVVYDKDSFGALPLDLRQVYCKRLAEYCKPDAIVYIEVKNKSGGKQSGGPPFHIEKEDLMETTSFGTSFEHVAALGEVYELDIPGAKQTAHILKRK